MRVNGLFFYVQRFTSDSTLDLDFATPLKSNNINEAMKPYVWFNPVTGLTKTVTGIAVKNPMHAGYLRPTKRN